MIIIIKNIKCLVQVSQEQKNLKVGSEMSELPIIENAFLEIEDERIKSFGSMDDWQGVDDWTKTEVLDAEGKMVFPSWCDSHTHLVFAASREGEFVDRINGMTYEEIALKGGGILNSAGRLHDLSEDELFKSSSERLMKVIKMGTGAIEMKSGYGLTVEDEIKILRVVKRLKQKFPIEIRPTFLGAHAIPKKYKENRTEYIDLIIKEMLPIIEEESLADFIDVFCETNYFTPEETDRILKAGKAIGLVPKIHVNQFTSIGGIQVGVENDALSVDHLEVMTAEDIEALKGSNTMPTVLPSCSFFLGIPYAPAKDLIAADLPVALATDFNPGSTPSGNMNFVISLACIKMKLTPEQAINAATINGAYAMGLQKECGTIQVGKLANFFITKKMPSYAYLPYSFGENPVEQVFLRGKKIK